MGLPRIKNNQIRPTSVQAMQAGGKDNLFIMTVTEHKCLATVLNYAPVPEMDARLDGARCIMAVKEKPPKITTETVTTSQVTRTVSRTSIHRETNQTGQLQTDQLQTDQIQTGQLQTGHRAGGRAVNGGNTGGPNHDAGGPSRVARGRSRDAGGRKAILHMIAEQG